MVSWLLVYIFMATRRQVRLQSAYQTQETAPVPISFTRLKSFARDHPEALRMAEGQSGDKASAGEPSLRTQFLVPRT